MKSRPLMTALPARCKKPSPGGWCSAQRIRNLYDCRWQSYLYYGVTPFGVTDEVEGSSVVPTYGDNRWLRPHQSALAGCQLLLQEKPFLRSTGLVAQSKGSPYTGEAFSQKPSVPTPDDWTPPPPARKVCHRPQRGRQGGIGSPAQTEIPTPGGKFFRRGSNIR